MEECGKTPYIGQGSTEGLLGESHMNSNTKDEQELADGNLGGRESTKFVLYTEETVPVKVSSGE